jgi:hypothetical protein
VPTLPVAPVTTIRIPLAFPGDVAREPPGAGI